MSPAFKNSPAFFIRMKFNAAETASRVYAVNCPSGPCRRSFNRRLAEAAAIPAAVQKSQAERPSPRAISWAVKSPESSLRMKTWRVSEKNLAEKKLSYFCIL